MENEVQSAPDEGNAGSELFERLKSYLADKALDVVTDALLDGMDHDALQALQWELDEAIQKLHAVKQRVHDAREREDLKNRPPKAKNPQVIGFGPGALPDLAGGKE